MNQPSGPQFACTPYPRVFTTSPRSPAAIRSRRAITSLRNRQQWATIRDAPEVRAAATIRSHSATDVAIGFSTRTWTPASSSAIGLRRVQGVRRGDDGGVDVGVPREGLPVRRDARDAVALGQRPGALLPMVGDGDELPVGMRQDAARVEVLDPPAAEQRDAGHRPPLRCVSPSRR